jgi:hypothetical protein
MSDPDEVRIRNRRYRPWVEIAGVLLITMIVSGVYGLLLVRWLEKIMLGCILVGVLGVLAIGAYGWLQVWDLRRGGVSQRSESVGRVLWHGLLGLRRRERCPVGGAAALIGLGWLLPARASIRYLTLGDGVEIDPPWHASRPEPSSASGSLPIRPRTMRNWQRRLNCARRRSRSTREGSSA